MRCVVLPAERGALSAAGNLFSERILTVPDPQARVSVRVEKTRVLILVWVMGIAVLVGGCILYRIGRQLSK